MATKSSNHLSGGKYTASHTSIIKAAINPTKAAAQLECVSKISLGLIQSLKNGPTSLKFIDEGPTCLLVKIRGSRSLQEIRIYTSNKEVVQATMNARLGS